MKKKKKTLSVDVGNANQTTSNMVSIFVYSLPLVCVLSDSATPLDPHRAELRR